ncbi:MAG: hypothetical protein BWY88_00818 [Synergistetes bacterium ADurb.Bin520]|nr:MAG: hypothetical protein BWY88_00818 [Synergistetes bacterium ADurb.Bin520]
MPPSPWRCWHDDQPQGPIGRAHPGRDRGLPGSLRRGSDQGQARRGHRPEEPDASSPPPRGAGPGDRPQKHPHGGSHGGGQDRNRPAPRPPGGGPLREGGGHQVHGGGLRGARRGIPRAGPGGIGGPDGKAPEDGRGPGGGDGGGGRAPSGRPAPLAAPFPPGRHAGLCPPVGEPGWGGRRRTIPGRGAPELRHPGAPQGNAPGWAPRGTRGGRGGDGEPPNGHAPFGQHGHGRDGDQPRRDAGQPPSQTSSSDPDEGGGGPAGLPGRRSGKARGHGDRPPGGPLPGPGGRHRLFGRNR